MLADAGRLLREVFRVLRPGGKYLCISLHVHSVLVLRACSGMEHMVRFGADGFSQSHSDSGDGALLAELRNALHSHPATVSGSTTTSSATPSGQRAPAFFHICTKPPVGRPGERARSTGPDTDPHVMPPMWNLSQYHAACKELDRSLLAQQRPEYLMVLLGLLGWCGLHCAGRAYSGQKICAPLLHHGYMMYTRTCIHGYTHTHTYIHIVRSRYR